MARLSDAEKARLSFYEIIDNRHLGVKNAWMKYRNFAGNPDKNYKPSDTTRRFSLLIDEPVAQRLIELGWNVKKKDPSNEEEESYYITDVVVNMNSKWPPKITLVTEFNGETTETPIDIDDLEKIDKGEIRIKRADLVVNLASGGGRYLDGLRIYERPSTGGWLDTISDDEMPFEE